MEIVWLRGSCFRLTSGTVSVLTDPFDLPPESTPLAADFVTLSRRGGQVSTVREPYRLIDGPGEYEIKGVPVTGLSLRLADEPAAIKSFVYSVLLDGVSVCHLGRLSRTPTTKAVQELGSPDVLLLPLGEPQGLAAPAALTLASQLESKVLIPMTFGGPDDQAALERFCKELGADPAMLDDRLSVTSSGLPATTRVARLKPQAAAAPS